MAQSGSPSGNWMDDWMGNGSWYVGAKVGANWMAEDTHLISSNLFAPPIMLSGASYHVGLVGAVEGGYNFGNGFRIEEEFGYRYNEVNNVTPYGGGRGSLHNYAAMTDVLYELPLDFPLHPYIGGGIGAADYAPDHIRGDLMPYPYYVGGPDKWGFAFQAIGGVAYNVDDHVALTLEYRFFEQIDAHPVGVGNDYQSNSAMFGVRYDFGAPPPQPEPAVYTPPPTAAPPANPRNYLVFFNFNKSDLTNDARQIVDQAASNAKNDRVTRLEVTGYTDTVGSDAYNMRLSRRRAESVASELEAQGVPSSEIEIFAKGKHDLLVPTADGVREPQNRRVQIVYGSGSTPSS